MVRKNPNKNRLTQSETRKFEAMLLAKRNEILGVVVSMEREALRRDRNDLSTMPTHMADIGTDSYEIENTLGLVDGERKLLAEIDDALDRIEDGTYGICEGSGEPIPQARLEAIPWARYCIAYASSLEKGLIVQEEHSETDSEDEADEEQDDN